jgi:D-alanyl-lipoteichoic acid acyltransferase DltB (MBOAT superfamily)
VVIADTCGRFANDLFEHSHMHSGAMLFLAALFFSFQIYCDFSGYSDIAIGTARLFGFELSINFSYPYFSRNVAEFWRRWHISLSTWFRDYVYIPLGGSRVDKLKIFRNVMIVFLVSGFWHGANWTFITWGALHACLFIPLIIAKRNRKYLEVVAADRLIPKGRELLSMLGTFIMVVLSWILFRAETLIEAGKIYKDLFSGLFEAQHYVSAWNLLRGMQVEFVAAFGIFILFEWMARKQEFALSILDRKIAFLPRLILYYFLIIMILWYGGDKQEFIYFQF